MSATLEDHRQLLVFAALLEGCGYYGCADDVKRDYVPQGQANIWQDDQTLELNFGAPLRPADEVDPRRFALVRYNVDIASGNDYYCYFDVCYRELGEIEAIPESLSWDPARPSVVRLHFAEPIPSSACDPWPGTWADYQALELVYLGVERDEGPGETGEFEAMAEPDQLAYFDDQPIEELGPDAALRWLQTCFGGGACELDEFCTAQGGYYDSRSRSRMISCP